MNLAHQWLCKSGMWRKHVHTRIIPWALEGLKLGTNILEVGPGPGITTDALRKLIPDLTCIEIDARYASSLSHRMAGDRFRMICADATALPLPDGKFDAVLCFTMLHHVPSAMLQDRLLSESIRVLRPGGMFVGSDSVSSKPFRLFHAFDTIVPVNPKSFPERLRTAGFESIQVEVVQREFRFRARKPE